MAARSVVTITRSGTNMGANGKKVLMDPTPYDVAECHRKNGSVSVVVVLSRLPGKECIEEFFRAGAVEINVVSVG